MPEVHLKLPHHQYVIHVRAGLLAELGALVRAVVPHDRAAILADQQVLPRHGQAAKQSLEQAGYSVVVQSVAAGENHKNLQAVAALYGTLVEHHMERKSPIFALGGGVIGDTAGFVAATYLRGVPFVQVPTTLLAMVDASVGGKVGVNLPQGKNLVGAFHQPQLVAIDTDTLRTLPAREFRGGLAECVKHGVIRDEQLFNWIDDHLDAILALDSASLVELVRWNVRIKANVVMADEKETGERAHLNFGHTFGHAIEAVQTYGASDGYSHGEAVALGMVAATRLAVNARRCDASVLDRLIRLLDRLSLPTSAKNLPPTDALLASMQLDKKVASGKVRLILPDRMGAVSIVGDTPASAIVAAWNSLRTS
ncbi:MAG: 3-dehydroquinate synthase [Phycisphaeraceae bacterium]|nr:3-dehydroquinate synthase [Phycisphaeraceae bacterium]